MPSYRYVAVTPDNERNEGILAAPDATYAARLLQRGGQIVLDIRPQNNASLWSVLNREVVIRPAISRRDLGLLFREWAGLIQAGISVHEALQISAENARRKSVRLSVQRMATSVREGTSLRNALASEKSIPAEHVAIVGAGEAAGDLGPTLQRIAHDLDNQRMFSERIRGALLYPAFLTVTATIAIGVLLVVVVPNLETLIAVENRASLPLVTRLVLGASETLRTHGFAMLAAAALAILLPFVVWRLPKGRRGIERLSLSLPVVGNFTLTSETSSYCRTLSALVAGGVQFSAALPLVLRTVKNSALRSDLEQAHERVIAGAPLADAINKSCPIPTDALVLMRMGEKTGRLHEALAQAAAILAQRAQRRMETISTLAAPVLTIGFGLIAGAVVYAMLSTILSINEMAYR